jgi:hypothetical protein
MRADVLELHLKLGAVSAVPVQYINDTKSASMTTSYKVVFLHIPKTAGQSVRAMLSDAFCNAAICPARSTEELCTYSIAELNSYRVHAPHGDWAMLDAIAAPKVVFSVFRHPLDRILSYYFFVFDKAANMSAEERKLPHHQGLNAVFEMTPDEYFFGGPPHLRAFIDDTYDNFYTYFLATRRWDGRRRIRNLLQRGLVTERQIIESAKSNLDHLDQVFTINQIAEVGEFLSRLSGRDLPKSYRVNVNKASRPEDRLQRLKDRGASEAVIDRLRSYSEMDNEIWDHIRERTKR